MTTSLQDLLTKVPSLNTPEQPFTFEVDGDRIVGRWDIVRATSLYPTEVAHMDKKYAITVSLDEGKHTFDFSEAKTDTDASGDSKGLHFSKEGFHGKSTSKEFGFQFGGVNKTEDGVSVKPVAYSFATSRIKEPLFTFLEQNGWHRKKGWLSGLFNR